ncbi:TetR/AcrR family transcriptional regulator [Komagataeibacter saccharivorans]|uniref:TetR/AcrR family transcriptional regulator n=1 Tax=Komagataeibacter saccharivorans TaxID=265959 RepID=UPI0039E7B315
MTTHPPEETGWRGSPEIWLDTAYDALIESGVDAVRILPLARKLNLSRTSFYWYFKDRDHLLSALIERWRTKNTGALAARAQAYAETIVEATLNVCDCWIDNNLFDAQFEFAIRSWGLQSTALAQEISQTDATRIDMLADMFTRFGYGQGEAETRARTIYLLQIGYISCRTHESLDTRMRRMSDYIEIFTGRTPQKRDLERFFARHNYTPAATEHAQAQTA